MSKLEIRFLHQLGEQIFDIHFSAPSKGIIAVLGRSGSGKTTLINVIAGLQTPRSGIVKIEDHVMYNSELSINVPTYKRKLGYVFQDARLFPHLKVKPNLVYGMGKEDNDYFSQIIELLALEPLLSRFPHQLSGGEKQRVSIGRALLSKPNLLLMDEPLASLDLPKKQEIMPFLERLSHEIKIPVVYVTHSIEEVIQLADHLVIIDQGQVVTSGPVEQVWSQEAMQPFNPNGDRSSIFTGNVIETSLEYDMSRVQISPNVSLWVSGKIIPIGKTVRLKVRASDISIDLKPSGSSSIRNVLPGIVVLIEDVVLYDGRKATNVLVELADSCQIVCTITLWAKKALNLTLGQSVFIQVKSVSLNKSDCVFGH